MTSQTKKFIELSDIIGLRLKCRNPECDTALLVGIERETSTLSDLLAASNQVMAKCPTCRNEWATLSKHAPFDSEIKHLLRLINDVKKLEPKFGCSLMLELKEEPKPSVSQA